MKKMSKYLKVIKDAKDRGAYMAFEKIVRMAIESYETNGVITYMDVDVGDSFAEILIDHQGMIELLYGKGDDSVFVTIQLEDLQKMHDIMPKKMKAVKSSYHLG